MSGAAAFHFDASVIGPRVYLRPGYRTFRQQLDKEGARPKPAQQPPVQTALPLVPYAAAQQVRRVVVVQQPSVQPLIAVAPAPELAAEVADPPLALMPPPPPPPTEPATPASFPLSPTTAMTAAGPPSVAPMSAAPPGLEAPHPGLGTPPYMPPAEAGHGAAPGDPHRAELERALLDAEREQEQLRMQLQQVELHRAALVDAPPPPGCADAASPGSVAGGAVYLRAAHGSFRAQREAHALRQPPPQDAAAQPQMMAGQHQGQHAGQHEHCSVRRDGSGDSGSSHGISDERSTAASGDDRAPNADEHAVPGAQPPQPQAPAEEGDGGAAACDAGSETGSQHSGGTSTCSGDHHCADLAALRHVTVPQQCKVDITQLPEEGASAELIESAASEFGSVESCYVRSRDGHNMYSAVVVFHSWAAADAFRAHGFGGAHLAMGTTRYCPRFLSGQRCRDGGCPYAHAVVNAVCGPAHPEASLGARSPLSLSTSLQMPAGAQQASP